jgi:hypothetical protein
MTTAVPACAEMNRHSLALPGEILHLSGVLAMTRSGNASALRAGGRLSRAYVKDEPTIGLNDPVQKRDSRDRAGHFASASGEKPSLFELRTFLSMNVLSLGLHQNGGRANFHPALTREQNWHRDRAVRLDAQGALG